MAYLDTNKEDMNCPISLEARRNPSSCIIRGSDPQCSSVNFSSDNLPYSKVCGRIHAYYYGDPVIIPQRKKNIDGNYVDGVSLTYGMGPRKHI